ncbi:MAG: mechanosensitive ion channel family protein [Verrucomicrobiota bacterium JB023]|nr:mechanosensitive ion channel family protein [Verrucomicrobiota bacterium JB023]
MRWLLLIIFLPSVFAQNPIQKDEANIPENIVIKAESGTNEEQLEQRLTSIFDQLEGMEEIEVEVAAGVVTLSGMVPDSQVAEEAVTLAKHTEEVVYVRNRLEDSVSISERLGPTSERASELWSQFLRKLPLILLSVGIFALFLLAGWFLGGRANWFRALGMRELSSNLAARVARLAFTAAGLVVALEILDATAIAGAILGVAGVAGIAFGFAFRNIIENYLAGILLGLRNPFETGDAIEVGDYIGKVVRLTSRDTVLITFDGNHVRLPNSLLMTSPLTNFSRNPLRRFEFAIGVSVELDLVAVRQLGMETLQSVNGILDDPAPLIVIEELGDSTVNMRFYAWINQTESDFLKAKSEAIRRVKDTFDDNGVEMPEPIYRVLMQEKSAVQENDKKKPQRHLAKEAEDETSADDTIDKQVRSALASEQEENLLDKKK